jgi:hypothetical protein
MVTLVLGAALLASSGEARPPWAGQGGGPHGQGGGRGAPAAGDRAVFHFLLEHRGEIARTVRATDDGVETVTESDDPAVAAKIQEHVRAMKSRLEEGRPIHRRDPLFAALFAHADAISMQVEETASGVRVRESSSDPYVAELIRAHAEVVSRFLTEGWPEVRRDHAVPSPRAP